MKSRRRRRKRGYSRTVGCLCAILITAGLGVLFAYSLPWAYAQFRDAVKKAAGETAEETVNMAFRRGADFPEITVTEETAGDFYYQQLTDMEKTIYLELLQGVQDMKETILLHAGRGDSPEKVYEYLLYDRPELFWCNGNSKMTVYEDYTEFHPGYACTSEVREERRRQIEQEAADCISGISAEASDYDKIKYVYEYIVKTVDYDENAPDNQNIYSALVGKSSVCAGYSRAAQYLLRELGIECIYVVGTAGAQNAHAWNIVNCWGEYYQMDVTFGDPVFLSSGEGEQLPENIVYYDYLCCTDTDILTDHVPSSEVSYPVCNSDDLNYYKMSGMYYESFDPQILLGDMNDSILAGEEMFVCKFSDVQVYARARDELISGLFPKAARSLASAYGLESTKYTYVEDQIHNKIIVLWNYE